MHLLKHLQTRVRKRAVLVIKTVPEAVEYFSTDHADT